MDRLREFGVASHLVAVATDVDDGTEVKEAVQESGGYDLVVQDLAPALETLVRDEHQQCVLVGGIPAVPGCSPTK